mmetsp:Transcript_25048/g.80772  ORF Transcript_25048/g.80772 Transcript_25048/m.80772 type:complete len:305 (+) Transcript_25048:1-915(+)
MASADVASAGTSPRRFTVSPFIAGALGGAVGITCTCPLEVVKTRAQSAHADRSMGMWRSFQSIVAREGVTGMWRGLGPNLLGVVPARSIYFGCYTFLKERLAPVLPGNLPAFASAAMSGCVVASTTSPIWMIKTRIQLQTGFNRHAVAGAPGVEGYTGYRDAVARIYAEEGLLGFYKGVSASYWGVSEGAIQFAAYDMLKRQLREAKGQELTKPELFGAAAVAKLFASATTYPLEVVRTRLREQRDPMWSTTAKYRGVLHALRRIGREEGTRGLYGGLVPHLMRVVPNAAIMFLVVESLVDDKL